MCETVRCKTSLSFTIFKRPCGQGTVGYVAGHFARELLFNADGQQTSHKVSPATLCGLSPVTMVYGTGLLLLLLSSTSSSFSQ